MLERKSLISLVILECILGSAIAHADPSVKTNSMNYGYTPYQIEFNFTALALRPSATNLNYVIYNKELPVQSPSWEEKELRPNYAFAFELGSRYINNGRDVAINWVHLNSTTSDYTVAPDASYFLGPDYEIGPTGLPNRDATGKVTFQYDVINLEVGQTLIPSEQIGLRFFGGISNAYLREKVNAFYYGNVLTGEFAGPFTTDQTVTSNFTGIGPRIGMSADYQFGCGFSLLGEGAVSALVGSVHAKTNYLSTSQELLIQYSQAENAQFIKDQSLTQVIPGFDTKLGLSYKYVTSNNIGLDVQAGFEAAVYVNAINQYLPESLVQPSSTGGIFVDTMSHTLSNYTVQGPYLKASVVF